MRYPRNRRRRHLWLAATALLSVLALIVAAGSARRRDSRATAGPATAAASVPGVPDVTGAGTTTGSVSLAALRAAAPGVTVSAPSLRIDGLDRGYLLLRPTNQSGPLPLLVVLHGISVSATQEAQRDELVPLVQAGRAVLVYPAGYDESWNVGSQGCCGTAGRVGVDDVGFVAAVLAATTAQLSIATGSVYLLGFSNGGRFAYEVMCQRPELFAAMAVVSATPAAACTAAAHPARSVLVAAGSADTELGAVESSADTGISAATALAATAATWRARDRCSSASTTRTAASARIETWAACADGTRVTTVLYQGMTHVWPRAAAVGSAQSGATLIWAFFSAQLSAHHVG